MTVHPDGGLLQALQHESALRRLARALLRNPADADDAVQHALAQAATGRRRPDMPLWVFLRTTLQRHAANVHKLSRRRSSRERLAARPEALPAADELVQRDQLRRRVADAVLALDEPYRTTVWLRWFEDLSTGAVARRMAVPVATVRTRLQRAHAQLRQRLDREYGDRRWAALALPIGAVIAVPSTLTVMLTMKKTLLALSLILLAVLGVVLLPQRAQSPANARPETPTTVTGALAEVAGGATSSESQRTEVALPAEAAAEVRSLQIVHADSTPAAALPVWFWQDDAARPQWTRHIADGQFDEFWPSGIAPLRGEAPRTSDLHTDRHGRVPLPDGPAPTCVTVLCTDEQWFSAEMPAGNGPLQLPDFAPVSITLLDAPAGAVAQIVCFLAWRERDGESSHGFACTNVDTGSGPGVLRCGLRRFRLSTGERIDVPAVRGYEVAFQINGRGFAVESELAVVRAPDSVVVRCTRHLPQLLVTVTGPAGVPTDLAGRAWLQLSGAGATFEDLEQGVAAFDAEDLEAGRHRLDVLMDDGEWLHAEVEAPIGPKDAAVHLCRGAGHQPMHVRVPGLAATAIAEVVLENTAGKFTAVARFTDVFPAPAPGYVAVPDGLLLNMLPGEAVRGCVVARDLRVACFATAAPGETVAGTWLPAAPPRTVDVAQCYRDCGDLPAMEVTVELQFQSREGRPEWRRILRHRRFPRMDDPTPAPVWRDLQPPCTMRARLVVRGGHTIDDAAELRVTDLTPR